MARFACIERLGALFVAALVSACSTPVVERDVAGYNHANYVLDLGICNMNDLVVNTFEGTGVVLVTTGVGFVYGAGTSGNNHAYHHDPSLGVLLVGGAVGATFGAGVGVYKAVEDITLETDACMDRQGYVVVSEAD
jgi:hypothetical protein